MKRVFCTIVSSNYLPQAEVLIDSFKTHHPNDQFHLLLIDVFEVEQPLSGGITYWVPEQIGIPFQELLRMRKTYDVVEFATSLKPFLLFHLLEPTISEVTYLDPDIKIFNHLDPAFDEQFESFIALTPHRLTPSKVEKLRELEKVFLKYGTFNLGFISVKNHVNSKKFLVWWQEHLLRDSTRRPISEVFTDQKWIDLVPSFFEYKIVRDFGYNIAPWNLDERSLSFESGNLSVNSSSLVKFVHFSQISGMLAAGDLTSEWQSRMNNSNMTEKTKEIFLQLMMDYSWELKSAAKHSNLQVKYRLLDVPYSQLNYLWRDRVNKKSCEKNIGISRIEDFLFSISNPLIKFVTRLDSANGLIWGIKSDFQRIKKRVKRS